MDKVANASINNLRISEADFVPSSEQSITVSLADLRQIIADAVQDAIQPLQDEVMELKATVASQGEEMAALKASVAEQKADYESMNLLRCEDFINVSKRVNAIEKRKNEPGETESARAEKISKYLLSQPGRRASYESLRGHLSIDKFALNDAIGVLMGASPGRYGITRSPGDKRKRTLVMIPR